MRGAPTFLAALLTGLFVFMSTTPSTWAAEPARVIGQYERLWTEGDLTEQDVRDEGDGLRIVTPPLASGVKIDRAFLDQRLGAWSTSTTFAVDDRGRIVLDGEDALFSPLELGEKPVFTYGSEESVQLADRPMWVSVAPGDSGSLRLNFDDGDSKGQTVFLSEPWLAQHGVGWPRIVHEDGTELEANYVEGGRGWKFEMTHFSFVIVLPAELPVKGRQAGIVFPHTGEVRWDVFAAALEVDVGTQLSAYDVLIPKTWVDDNIPRPKEQTHSFIVETVGGIMYYVVALTASQTPATLRVGETPWVHFEFNLNLTHFKQEVAAGRPITIPIGPQNELEIYLDAEPIDATAKVFMSNGQNDTLSGTMFIENRTMMGTSVSVDLSFWEGQIISPALHGEIATPSIVVSYGPVGESAGSDDVPMGGEMRGQVAFTEPNPEPVYPYDPPSPAVTRRIATYFFFDTLYSNRYTGNTEYTHAADAWNKMKPMWESYSGNRIRAIALYEIPNVYTGSNCVTFLELFDDFLDDNGYHQDPFFDEEIPGEFPPHWVLLTGNTAIASNNQCLGAGWGGVSILPPFGSPSKPIDSFSAGYDWSPYRGQASSAHLGKLMAQELGHNWGEPDHPCQAVDGEYSTICNNNLWDSKKFWLHYADPAKPSGANDSRQRIIDGTSQYVSLGYTNDP